MQLRNSGTLCPVSGWSRIPAEFPIQQSVNKSNTDQNTWKQRVDLDRCEKLDRASRLGILAVEVLPPRFKQIVHNGEAAAQVPAAKYV